jgi:C_GCAxxG_C_C family probable redox protein
MKSREESAVVTMIAGGNCAQAVLCAFAGELGLGKGMALKLASGFGAGMGRRQEVCGAVTGGIMAIGLRHGPARVADREAKERVYGLTRQLLARFAGEFGSCRCRDLLGLDLLTDGGQKRYKEEDLAEKVCRPCVRGAVRLVAELLMA